jgi:hypothetical protein
MVTAFFLPFLTDGHPSSICRSLASLILSGQSIPEAIKWKAIKALASSKYLKAAQSQDPDGTLLQPEYPLSSEAKLQVLGALVKFSPSASADPGVNSSLVEVERHCLERVAHRLSPGQITLLLNHLSKVASIPQELQPRFQTTSGTSAYLPDALYDGDDGFQIGSSMSRLLSHLGYQTMGRLLLFRDEDLVALTSAMARLGWRPGLLLQGICQRLVARLHRLDPAIGQVRGHDCFCLPSVVDTIL